MKVLQKHQPAHFAWKNVSQRPQTWPFYQVCGWHSETKPMSAWNHMQLGQRQKHPHNLIRKEIGYSSSEAELVSHMFLKKEKGKKHSVQTHSLPSTATVTPQSRHCQKPFHREGNWGSEQSSAPDPGVVELGRVSVFWWQVPLSFWLYFPVLRKWAWLHHASLSRAFLLSHGESTRPPFCRPSLSPLTLRQAGFNHVVMIRSASLSVSLWIDKPIWWF